MDLRQTFALILLSLTCACRPLGSNHSRLHEQTRYKQSFQFISQVKDTRDDLILRGDFGENIADRRFYLGNPKPGNFVSGPGMNLEAASGFMRAKAKIKADFYKDWVKPVGAIMAGTDEYLGAHGSYVVDLVYRKPGQDPASPTVAASRTISLDAWTPVQDIDIGTADFEGDLASFDVRVRDIQTEQYVEISVYNTVIDVVWQTKGT